MSKSDPDFWRDGDPTGEGAPDSEVSDDYAAKYLRKPRKRAAIIITEHAGLDVTSGWGYGETSHYERVPTSEQLLADLRRVCDLAWGSATGRADVNIVTRVRAALGEVQDGVTD